MGISLFPTVSATEKKILIVRNALFTLTRGGFGLVLNLVFTPIFLRYLGIDTYGTWVLITVLAANLAAVDFGMAAATTRFVAFYVGRKDPDSINRCVSTGVFLFVIFGILYVTLFIFAKETIRVFLSGNKILSTGAHFSLSGIFILFFINFTGAGLSASLDGLQRIDINQKINFFTCVSGCLRREFHVYSLL